MTSEPDSTPRRRPPTIDLTATEIESETPGGGTAGDDAGATAGSQAPTGSKFTSRLWDHSIGLVAGLLIMTAIFVGLRLAGIVTARPPSAATEPTSTSDISAQLAKIQAQLQTAPADQALAARLAAMEAQTKTVSDALNTRLAAVEAQTKSVTDSLAAINRRLDDIAVAAKSAGEHADAASAAAKGAAENAVQRSDLDALASRIAALDNEIKTLSEATANRPASADDRMARAAVAAESLRAVVERGAPYQAELAAVKSFGADQSAVASLEPFAASGVPSAQMLAHELAQIMPSLLKTTETASGGDASFLGRLENNAKSLVRVTPVGTPAGDDPASVIARLDTDATRADIGAALADIDRLPEATKALTESWVQKAHARDAAIAASRQIAGNALAALGNTSTQ